MTFNDHLRQFRVVFRCIGLFRVNIVKQRKLDPYYLRQKYTPRTVVIA